MDILLSPKLSEGAILRDKEYAWELAAFPIALENAPLLGYACLGGQFWFLLPDNTLYEPFWLEANAEDRAQGEPWPEFSRRSCAEVLLNFKALMNSTNFIEEARKFGSFDPIDDSGRSKVRLLFNAYFVTAQEFNSLGFNGLRRA
jgi:hypothetical protein